MLRILGSARQLCHGITRREMLRAGGLGLAALGGVDLALPDLLRLSEVSAAETAARPRSFGRAKAVILLHLYGSPSQIETFDPKPDAPVEIRGELKSIDSSLPGCQVCELLPHSARVMDRTTVLRSLTHPYPLHGVAFALTGTPTIDGTMELSPRDPRHWPFFGSVVDFVDRNAGQRRDVPANIAMPFPFSSRRVGEVPRAGPYAAFLGAEHNPVWTDFVGQGTKGITKTLEQKKYSEHDPYMGSTADSYFVVPSATTLEADVTLDRLSRRRSLLEQFDVARRKAGVGQLAATSAGREFDRHQQSAFKLLESGKLRTALDIRQETPENRALYGDTLFGQSCLAARRLVEAGSRVVTVFWDEFGLAGSAWDTHWNHYQRMREELCPGFDRAWYGLITDLDRRGMLDETLVVCNSEHGRTPKLSTDKGGGRDHWSRVYSSLVAGGGTARGRVVGASDKQGGDVARCPISPKDLLATMYHLLGIDPQSIVRDALGRPLPLVDGHVIGEALA